MQSEVNKIINSIAKELSGNGFWITGLILEFIPSFRRLIVEFIDGFGKSFANNLMRLDKIMIFILAGYLLFISIISVYQWITSRDITESTYFKWCYFLKTLSNPYIMWSQLIMNVKFFNLFFDQKIGWFKLALLLIIFFQCIIAFGTSVEQN